MSNEEAQRRNMVVLGLTALFHAARLVNGVDSMEKSTIDAEKLVSKMEGAGLNFKD